MASQEILDRIEKINSEIKGHRENIELLSNYAHKHFNPKKNCYMPHIAKYDRIPKSGDRYLWTLQNLRKQVMLLENELAVLNKYSVEVQHG